MENKKSDFVCRLCGKTFNTWTYRQPKYCSLLCKNKAGGKAKKPRSKPMPNLRGGIVEWKCKQCGKQMKTYKSRVRDTCSRSCAKIFFTPKLKFKCATCGISKTVNPSGFRKYCSRKCASSGRAKSGRFAGSRNPNWKGGMARAFRGRNWQSQSLKARKRDLYLCQSCGKVGVSVHHIIPYRKFKGNWRKANELSNLITLCVHCHSKIEHGKLPCPKPKS